MEEKFDICIVGAGTGGMATVYAIADMISGSPEKFKYKTLKIAVVEAQGTVGGTSTNAWVDCWIPAFLPPHMIVIACDKFNISEESIYSNMLPSKFGGSDVPTVLEHGKLLNIYNEKFGLCDINKESDFSWFLGHSIIDVIASNRGSVSTIQIKKKGKDNNETKNISASIFIDATGDGTLCRMAKANYFLGEDPYERFNEPLMEGKQANIDFMNEPSLFFEVKKDTKNGTYVTFEKETFDKVTTVGCDGETIFKPPYICEDGYKCNGRYINTMTGLGITGQEALNYDKALETAEERIWEYWKYIKFGLQHELKASSDGKAKFGAFDENTLEYYITGKYAPMLGVREAYRIECDYMTTQQDLTKKLDAKNSTNYIACNSHSVDLHIKGNIDYYELQNFNNNELVPSGLSFECLIPKSLNNVLIASRAFGASHIAASSRRTNADISQIGYAVGCAAVQFVLQDYKDVRSLDVTQIQKECGFIKNVEKVLK